MSDIKISIRGGDILEAHRNISEKLKGEDMKIKTVAYAVELYKGVFPDGQCGLYDDWSLITGDGVGVLGADHLMFNLTQVCTRQEFEDYVRNRDLDNAAKNIANAINEDSAESILHNLVFACDNNTGNEPSLSCYYHALDKAKDFLDPRTDKERIIDEAKELCKNLDKEDFDNLFNVYLK